MDLVIAEKPSVAQGIAAVIGAKDKMEGYMEGNGYLVSWCIGHLAGLASAEVYDARYAKWCYDDLPIIPEEWKYVVGKGKKKQFDLLKKLMREERVTAVVNACDAGREGEAIFRTVYQLAGCTKPMKRLWISSMEDEAVRRGFGELRPGSDYDGLYDAARCRNQADWLVVKREAEIDAFSPEPFYIVVLDLGDFSVSGKRISDKDEAKQILEACRGETAVVKEVVAKKKKEKPPALYDLTTLQREANRILGYTAQQTLDYLQSLYEKKLCTYPRTDSRYLTSDMEHGLPELVQTTAEAMPFAAESTIQPDVTRVINNKKVTDHHAILPTKYISRKQVGELPLGERCLLELVCLRFLCAVGAPHEYEERTVTAECAGQFFTAKGKETVNPGWKALEEGYRSGPEKNAEKKEEKEQRIPEVKEGDSFPVSSASIRDGKTAPPGHYTEDSLLAAMENAGAKDMPEDAERKGLGTPATRAAILEKLVTAGFMERKKVKKSVQLLPTDTAVALITVLPEQLQSPLLTAEWEYRLKEVERGELEADAFLQEITGMLRELVKSYQAVEGAEVLFPQDKEVIGKCPRCSGNVTESGKGFFCENKDCQFALWKNSRFFEAKKRKLTKEVAKRLLADGKVKLTGCYSERTGKKYDAVVILDDDGKRTSFMMEFEVKRRSMS